MAKQFSDFLVAAINDVKWGQSYIVITESKQKNIEEEIKNYLEDQLPRYKLPKDVIKIDKIPKNDMGKLQKSELQKNINFDLI